MWWELTLLGFQKWVSIADIVIVKSHYILCQDVAIRIISFLPGTTLERIVDVTQGANDKQKSIAMEVVEDEMPHVQQKLNDVAMEEDRAQDFNELWWWDGDLQSCWYRDCEGEGGSNTHEASGSQTSSHPPPHSTYVPTYEAAFAPTPNLAFSIPHLHLNLMHLMW